MKPNYLGLILAVTVITIFGISPQATAAPTTVAVQKQIEVHGRVLPAHSVIINEDGDILEILSNTTEDVKPRIYVDRIAAETEVPLTDDVYIFYRHYVPEGSSKVGSLYKAGTNLISSNSIQKLISLQQLLR